jgi:cell division protease FtsH
LAGADLANLVNEAALLAARRSVDQVGMHDFESAKDKVLMGVERRSISMSDEEKRNTAFHEAGHTLVALLLPKSDPVHKVSIIPRGRAMGVTQQLPAEDRYSYDTEYVTDRIAVLMGGRIAEEIVYGRKTTGAGNDIEQATELARRMVCEWGMSSLGTIAFAKSNENPFLGRDLAKAATFSESTAARVDREIKHILNQSYDRAYKLVSDNRAMLDAIAEGLMDYETLDGEEVRAIVDGRKVDDVRAERKRRATEREQANRLNAARPVSEDAEREPERRAPAIPGRAEGLAKVSVDS